MKFRAAYDYDVKAASNECEIICPEPSLTVQSDAEDADINVLMYRFGITGKMPENPRIPMYGDFTGVKDYQSALNAISEAFDGFMQLPANIRSRFNNNPQELLEFVANDANIKEAQSLGLLKEKIYEQRGTGSAAGGSAPPASNPTADPIGSKSGETAGGGKAA